MIHIHLGSAARTKTLMVCFVNFFSKERPLPTFPMMIYSILLISSIIVPVNALVFVLPSKCFINFFVDFVALDLTIYLKKCADEQELYSYNTAVDMLEEKYDKAKKKGIPNPEFNAVQNWIIYVQGQLLYCASYGFTKNYQCIMNGTFNREVMSVSRGNALSEALGSIAFEYVFKSQIIYKTEIAAGNMINFLLDKFVPAAVKYDTADELSPMDKRIIYLISDNYRQIYKIYSSGKDENEKLYLRLLLVTDYICGMTDSFAKRLYQELNGIM